MQAKNHILDELRSLDAEALLLEINRQMVDNSPKGAPYLVPAGYFEAFPNLVMTRIHDRASVFSVPDGYFEGFAAQVLGRIKAGQANQTIREELAALSELVSGISREMPYTLPEGYFEEVSPLLTILKEKTTYSIPEEGYFDHFATGVTAKIDRPVTARGIPIGGRKAKVLNGNWWKYSAAAMAACINLIFSWPQFHIGHTETRQAQVDIAQSLYKVPDQEIQNYMDDQNSIPSDPIANG